MTERKMKAKPPLCTAKEIEHIFLLSRKLVEFFFNAFDIGNKNKYTDYSNRQSTCDFLVPFFDISKILTDRLKSSPGMQGSHIGLDLLP
jgi:hypothetical protein